LPRGRPGPRRCRAEVCRSHHGMAGPMASGPQAWHCQGPPGPQQFNAIASVWQRQRQGIAQDGRALGNATPPGPVPRQSLAEKSKALSHGLAPGRPNSRRFLANASLAQRNVLPRPARPKAMHCRRLSVWSWARQRLVQPGARRGLGKKGRGRGTALRRPAVPAARAAQALGHALPRPAGPPASEALPSQPGHSQRFASLPGSLAQNGRCHGDAVPRPAGPLATPCRGKPGPRQGLAKAGRARGVALQRLAVGVDDGDDGDEVRVRYLTTLTHTPLSHKNKTKNKKMT
jgi:hypothetical protein